MYFPIYCTTMTLSRDSESRLVVGGYPGARWIDIRRLPLGSGSVNRIQMSQTPRYRHTMVHVQ